MRQAAVEKGTTLDFGCARLGRVGAEKVPSSPTLHVYCRAIRVVRAVSFETGRFNVRVIESVSVMNNGIGNPIFGPKLGASS